MSTVFAYSLIVSVTLIFAQCGYSLGKGGSSRLQRTLLLGIYALALVIVPLFLSIDVGVNNMTTIVGAETKTSELTVMLSDGGAKALQVISLVYIVGLSVCVLLTVQELLHTLSIARGAEVIHRNGMRICLINRKDIAPFSLGRMVVLNRDDFENTAIMTHEAAHVACHHTIDMIIAQFVTALCWYCPSAWIMRRDLRLTHEFQADEAVIDSGEDFMAYSRLLMERTAKISAPTLTNSFNYNNLKQRIRMMKATKQTRHGGLVRIMLPLLTSICAAALLSVPAIGNALESISHAALTAKGLDVKKAEAAFAIYGVDIDNDIVKSGNFMTVNNFEDTELTFDNVDGVIFPKIGAIFCSDKGILDQLTPQVTTYMVDGRIMTRKEFSKIPSSDLCKVIVSGQTAMVYTREQTESKFFDALEDAVNAENR